MKPRSSRTGRKNTCCTIRIKFTPPIIDHHGKVKEVICVDVSYPKKSYWREVEYTGKSLQLNGSTPFIFQGVTLDTDLNDIPCADACVAFRMEYFQEGHEFKPKVISPGTNSYRELDSLFRKYLKKSVDEYFFTLYPSIRYRRKKPVTAKSISSPPKD